MCRIAGMADISIPLSQTEKMVEQMCQLLKHGGPDDGGIYIAEDCNLVIGNRRLSLLDLSKDGHMPMSYKGQFYITYNGEIYNYQELKSELISLGHQFSNKTDTEVILASFAQWGSLSFSMFKGMFAFALWDSIKKELYLVRDCSGIKPLYYSISNTGFKFASEVRALTIVSSNSIKQSNWPVYMLAYGHLPEPVTTEESVKPLPKGFYLKYNFTNQQYHFQSFAHYSFSNQITDVNIAQNQTRSVLQNAIESQMIADAPIGVFLSGGLDSGIIASLASKSNKEKINALSIYFEEKEFSEKKYQDILIKKLNCSHHQFLLKEEEFQNSFPSILDNMDLPSCDGINTWFISKFAAEKGLKAVLSGLGGDELFGGYPSFNRYNKSEWLMKLPDFFKGIGKSSSSKKLNRMSYLKMNGTKGIYLFLRGHFTPNDIASQLGSYENEVWDILEDLPVLMNLNGVNDKNKASWMEFNLYMQNQLLRDSDVMSMIHGVEIRVPFLDDNTIRIANKISPEVKYAGKLPKQFLIDTFYEDIPREIWDRPKMGFSFPFAKWLSNSSYVQDLMLNGSENSKSNYYKFISGKLHWSHLMSLIILNHRKVI